MSSSAFLTQRTQQPISSTLLLLRYGKLDDAYGDDSKAFKFAEPPGKTPGDHQGLSLVLVFGNTMTHADLDGERRSCGGPLRPSPDGVVLGPAPSSPVTHA